MAVLPILTLEKFRAIVGDAAIDNIFAEASSLSERSVLHINSTYEGGGVAEILNSLVILMNDAGIDTDWRVLHGNLDFFTITKKFHNALQGQRIHFTTKKKELYYMVNVNNSMFIHINQDFVFIHDPQPLPLITCYMKQQPWVWRCHIDISNPVCDVWEYLKTFIQKYDAMVVSMDKFKQPDLEAINFPQYVVPPSINPLNIKNRPIPQSTISRYLSRYNIDLNRPVISQISRFDKWKDPLGVIKVFKAIRDKCDCQLVLAGSLASDDPEGQGMMERLEKIVQKEKDIHLLLNAPDIVINALQRQSRVVIQKSLKEGFALTVSEALWKGTPVVASNVGGIPAQVINGVTGYVLEPQDNYGFAKHILWLLKHPDRAEEMGAAGREHVRTNFLITRHLLDYIRIIKLYVR
jgi:trehalose synthase